jgi:hypothetical protein
MTSLHRQWPVAAWAEWTSKRVQSDELEGSEALASGPSLLARSFSMESASFSCWDCSAVGVGGRRSWQAAIESSNATEMVIAVFRTRTTPQGGRSLPLLPPSCNARHKKRAAPLGAALQRFCDKRLTDSGSRCSRRPGRCRRRCPCSRLRCWRRSAHCPPQ